MNPFSPLPTRLWTLTALLSCCMVSCTLNSRFLHTAHIDVKQPLVTFIIPTIGRPSLELAIGSLQKQKNKRWEAIVIFDGIPPHKLPEDPQIKFMQIKKTGSFNHAGRVRNVGIKEVKTPWIAFLDDDDTLSDDYVDRLEEEINLLDDLAVVIFRMYHPNRSLVIPAPEVTDFFKGDVGISFSMKTALYKKGLKFRAGNTEDFDLLDRIRAGGYKMVISPYLTYWIRKDQTDCYPSLSPGNRIYIN